MRAQEIRKEALSKLEGNWIPMIGVCLLTVIAVAALNWLSVLLIPLLIPGLCAFTLKLIRGAKPEITDLVSTYKNYLNALVAYVLFAVIIAVWTFLIVVPCVFFIHLLFAEIFLDGKGNNPFSKNISQCLRTPSKSRHNIRDLQG